MSGGKAKNAISNRRVKTSSACASPHSPAPERRPPCAPSSPCTAAPALRAASALSSSARVRRRRVEGEQRSSRARRHRPRSRRRPSSVAQTEGMDEKGRAEEDGERRSWAARRLGGGGLTLAASPAARRLVPCASASPSSAHVRSSHSSRARWRSRLHARSRHRPALARAAAPVHAGGPASRPVSPSSSAASCFSGAHRMAARWHPPRAWPNASQERDDSFLALLSPQRHFASCVWLL